MTQLTLPLKINSYGTTPITVLTIVLSSLLLIAGSYIVAPFDPAFPSFAPYVPTFIIGSMAVGAAIYMIKACPPYSIEINQLSLTFTPLPIMGFAFGRVTTTHKVSEFASVDTMIGATKGGVFYYVVMHRKSDFKEIPLDVRSKNRSDVLTKAEANDFVRQLGSLLNLKANEHA